MSNTRITSGSLWVAPGTTLPPGWSIDASGARSGWSPLVDPLQRLHLDQQLDRVGWRMLFRAGVLAATVVGWHRPRMLERALARVFSAVDREHCNLAEIDTAEFHTFWGIPYLNVTAHARVLQCRPN
jgi:hypothetical protein